ncbi:amine oxidase [Bacillus sp. AFS077874]|uniref:flavin monoamine oxidase family protein n=1 Tax=unclassified Bacillus (in: firmicutes) TaxID=185979 RepID=UPI000BEC26F9|nr:MULTISPECIES: flavin monoamine oxidase family protein [unclassified Bacillus (in: firmicutes)]PEC50947.1 amine oxidase [Bacillus sp. AFS096315]PFM83261.1 amine oxidase [Bacillus sp. AFS077874]
MPRNMDNQLSTEQMINLIRNGLKKSVASKNIIIVGAGLSGLVAASLLKDAGHGITILEANNRLGGRVYTLRSPFSNGLSFNTGPMRIHDTHSLTLEYIKKFQLTINEFINRTPNDIIFANGIKTRLNQFEQNPSILNYPVAPDERKKTAEDLLLSLVQPFIDFIKQNPKKNWDLLEKQYKKHSLGFMLSSHFSDGAIDMIGVLLDLEAYMGMSFIEVLREMVFFSSTTRFYEITGGMDRLPYAFLPQLKENTYFHHKMTKLVQNSTSVTIHTTHQQNLEHYTTTGDLTIITVPFSALRFVKVEPYDSFSYMKRKAIREINYLSATKIGVEFKSRFWEKEGQQGGKSITDLPIRFTYYPSLGIGTQGGAVILASYTWADESLTWGSLSEDDRIQYVLKDLAEIYGPQVYNEFVTGASVNWSQNPYSCGAFTAFEPGQETELYPYIAIPEGRVHFAGEHTTLTHGWMQGAIESGIRVAHEVNEIP